MATNKKTIGLIVGGIILIGIIIGLVLCFRDKKEEPTTQKIDPPHTKEEKTTITITDTKDVKKNHSHSKGETERSVFLAAYKPDKMHEISEKSAKKSKRSKKHSSSESSSDSDSDSDSDSSDSSSSRKSKKSKKSRKDSSDSSDSDSSDSDSSSNSESSSDSSDSSSSSSSTRHSRKDRKLILNEVLFKHDI